MNRGRSIAARLIGSSLALALASGGCGKGGAAQRPPDGGDGEDGGMTSETDGGAPPTEIRRMLLGAMGSCALDTARRFLTEAEALDGATQTLVADGSATARQAAREAWSAAMNVWQEAEVMQFGPAATMPSAGARDLRAFIYSWPLVGRCAIDETLVSQRFAASTFLATALINVRGLAAAEYLLFHEGTDNGCGPSSAINGFGTWATLAADPAELDRRKRAYAAVVTADVREKAAALVSAWDPAGENFLRQMSEPGTAGSAFSSVQTALNAASDALFYLEDPTKDMKVGEVLGLTGMECLQPPCLDRLESAFAGRSKAHVRANVVGFRRLFVGCGPDGEGTGFDDLLAGVGAEATATTMKQQLDGIDAALDAIAEPDLREALQRAPASVRPLYDALRALIVTMKADFVSILGFVLPPTVIGDNDA